MRRLASVVLLAGLVAGPLGCASRPSRGLRIRPAVRPSPDPAAAIAALPRSRRTLVLRVHPLDPDHSVPGPRFISPSIVLRPAEEEGDEPERE